MLRGVFRRVWPFKYPGRIDGGIIAKPKHARHLPRPVKREDALDAARAGLSRSSIYYFADLLLLLRRR